MARPALVLETKELPRWDKYSSETIVAVNPTSLQDALDDIYERLDGPQRAVQHALNNGDVAVVFVIAGGQSVPITYKKGDSFEALVSSLKLLLG